MEGEPFGPIVETLERLQRGERLVLVNSFEPVPLYDLLDDRGFDAETTRVGEDEWYVLVEHAE